MESFNDTPPSLLVLVGVVADGLHNGRSWKGLKRFGIPPDGRGVNAHMKDASGRESTQNYRCSSIGARVLNVHSTAPKKDGESVAKAMQGELTTGERFAYRLLTRGQSIVRWFIPPDVAPDTVQYFRLPRFVALT